MQSGQLLEAFILGNATILGNVCILPLYPGLMTFLAGNAGSISSLTNALLYFLPSG